MSAVFDLLLGAVVVWMLTVLGCRCRWQKRPLDFIARLAALVPKPRVNLRRFHGVFAPSALHNEMKWPSFATTRQLQTHCRSHRKRGAQQQQPQQQQQGTTERAGPAASQRPHR